jgi:menaquinone-dependent protoporphyrinogen oxidase
MKILVAVASKYGSTREIAQAIAEELRAANLSVDLRDASEVGIISGYDAVILGSAIYAGHWLPDAKNFARRCAVELSKIPVWLFSSGPVGAENPQPQDDPNRLAAPMGEVKIRDHRVFVGKLDFDQLGLADRLVIKAFKSPLGDFRNWDDIRGWARGIAAELLTQRMPLVQ